ncbi:hypothetical protein [Symbioplanes lichenis]|uniref:hypothetical protein n=1 Tax=Symbioplanes lichenis TaxID=1629072 RepID=UPI00273A56FA|nr:hypothetical protein [Actinoplanes lichenis]
MAHRLVVALIALFALVGPVVIAGPAQASSGAGSFTFDASPEPVKKGAYVTLSGRNTNIYFQSGVKFFFKADGSDSWVYQNSTPVRNGTYSRRQAQNHSGTWKAVAYCECDSEGAPSRTDHVAVRGVQLPGIVTGCTGGYYVDFRPSVIDISCTTYWGYTSVRWKSVTMTSARATAILHYNDCDPYCAGGRYHTEKVTLTFSRVRVHHGVLTFTKMTEHPSGYSYGLYPAAFS